MVREILSRYNKSYHELSTPVIEEMLEQLSWGSLAIRETLINAPFITKEIDLLENTVALSAAEGRGIDSGHEDFQWLKLAVLSARWGKSDETVRGLIRRQVSDTQNVIDGYVHSSKLNMDMARFTLSQIVDAVFLGTITMEAAKRLTRKLTTAISLVCRGPDLRFGSAVSRFLRSINADRGITNSLYGLIAAVDDIGGRYLRYAVTDALSQRVAYNLERIARTEAQRAWFSGFLARWKDNPDVFGYKWVLSKRHTIFDQCDVCANANVGFGKGVYPKNRMPRIPLHPNCMCTIIPVFKQEVDKTARYDEAGVTKYIRNLSAHEQLSLFGEKGREIFRKTGNWEQNLRGWEGFINSNEFSS